MSRVAAHNAKMVADDDIEYRPHVLLLDGDPIFSFRARYAPLPSASPLLFC